MALGLLVGLAGAPFAAAALYLLVLAVASLRNPSRAIAPASTGPRIAVLVPAHDEEALVGRCIRSLLDQSYPAGRYRVVVIADNCSDATTWRASQAGAEVMERHEPGLRGKGHALRWAMDALLESGDPPDAVVVVDADSVADHGLLAGLAAEFAAGADAVQAEYLVLAEDSSARSRLLEAAFLLFHRVRLGGRAALGLPVNLVGNGMLFSRKLLHILPWNAFSGVEDLEYSINLRLAGLRPRYAPRALVRGPVPHGYSAMGGQRRRWEGGRFHVVRTRLGELLGRCLRGQLGLLDVAVDLAVPPLGLLVMATLAGNAAGAALIGAGVAPAWCVLSWALALAGVVAFVGVGLRSAGAPASTYAALLESPRFLLWKLVTYARLASGFDPARWERARRASPPGPPAPGRAAARERLEIAGVPLDRVDTTGALERLRVALRERRQTQVATVNLDFLVGAQRDAQVREVLRRSELNVADGKPVVWLSRLLGRPLPERIAGADLVPLLVAEAARSGARVFLLGGEGGVTAEVAERLRREHPRLELAGWLEPPRASLAADSEAIVELVNRSEADLLLVALGHPKQELWIARHRHLLTSVSVLVGVGCVFDLLAGRLRRAPVWMQRSGLEWLHRLLGEPRRLIRRYLNDAAWLLMVSARIVFRRATGRRPSPA